MSAPVETVETFIAQAFASVSRDDFGALDFSKLRATLRRKLKGDLKAKDRDLVNARAVLEAVATAMFIDTATVWKQLAGVRTAIDQIDNLESRRSRCLEAVEAVNSVWWKPDLDARRAEFAVSLIRDLAHFEPKFSALASNGVVAAFRKRRKPEALAAALSCSVGAFGDSNEERARKAFYSARTAKTKRVRK